MAAGLVIDLFRQGDNVSNISLKARERIAEKYDKNKIIKDLFMGYNLMINKNK